jgi:hypothetical protein
VPMASASCIALRQARLGGRGVGQVRVQISHSRTRPRARARAPCAPALRAQQQGRPEAAPHAWRPAGLGGTCGRWVGIPGL